MDSMQHIKVYTVWVFLIDLHYRHIIVHFKEHRVKIFYRMIWNFFLIAFGFALDLFGMHINMVPNTQLVNINHKNYQGYKGLFFFFVWRHKGLRLICGLVSLGLQFFFFSGYLCWDTIPCCKIGWVERTPTRTSYSNSVSEFGQKKKKNSVLEWDRLINLVDTLKTLIFHSSPKKKAQSLYFYGIIYNQARHWKDYWFNNEILSYFDHWRQGLFWWEEII